MRYRPPKERSDADKWDQWIRVLNTKPCPPAGTGVHGWVYNVGRLAVEWMGVGGDISMDIAHAVEREIATRASRPLQRNEVADVLQKRGFESRYETRAKAVQSAKIISSDALPKDWKLHDCDGRFDLREQARRALRVCFAADEPVSICPLATAQSLPDSGTIRSREEWVKRVGEVVHPKWLGGVHIRINPTEGACDSDVLAHRYVLVEGDQMAIADQVSILKKSRLPIAMICESGGKSIHAWVRVDADCFEEYELRRESVWMTLEASGFKVDRSCKNPARYSRLAGCFRGGKRIQSLLALGHGVPTINWKVGK